MGRFAELLGHDGVEEDLELRSSFGLMAFHGGNLEEGTDLVASSVAEQAGASLYAVRQPAGLRWHVPSVEVGPDESAALAAFVDHVEIAIAVHGYGREGLWTTLLLGGRNRELAAHVGVHLRRAMPGYQVVDDLEAIPRDLRGVHRANPVNLPAQSGVQLELPPRPRSRTVPMWRDLPASDPIPHQLDLISGLVAAIRSWGR
ncbi:MAG: poly-gamma-glutamate hydrolase family protein [Acidimicrobiales bacterium]